MSYLRLSSLHYRALWISWILLWGSGVWWILSRLLSQRSMFQDEASLPQEILALTVHGVAAYIFLFMLGTMLWHINAGLKNSKNKFTGILLLAITAILSGTGLLLYYSAAPLLHWGANLIHIVLGVLIIAIFFIHQARKR